jgi:hypothetical protein
LARAWQLLQLPGYLLEAHLACRYMFWGPSSSGLFGFSTLQCASTLSSGVPLVSTINWGKVHFILALDTGTSSINSRPAQRIQPPYSTPNQGHSRVDTRSAIGSVLAHTGCWKAPAPSSSAQRYTAQQVATSLWSYIQQRPPAPSDRGHCAGALLATVDMVILSQDFKSRKQRVKGEMAVNFLRDGGPEPDKTPAAPAPLGASRSALRSNAN